MQAIRMGLVKSGDRVVVSQCPRVLSDGLFEEAAVVKFIVAGDNSSLKGSEVGSCMDLANMHAKSGSLPVQA